MVAVVSERSLTVDQVAEALQVSPWTVRIWLRARRLRGFRPGGTKAGWRIRESDLERFIAETANRPVADEA
jgi:excisionase family DNA binding protein